MRVLIYKRTHNGDPDKHGCFGAYDCMGAVRSWDFDAVIGVGGTGSEAAANGIAEKVNWVGIGPHKRKVDGKRGPEVTFDQFLDYGTGGPRLRCCAPRLAARLYDRGARFLLHGMSDIEQEEAERIVQQAKREHPARRIQARGSRVGRSSRCGDSRKLRRCK